MEDIKVCIGYTNFKIFKNYWAKFIWCFLKIKFADMWLISLELTTNGHENPFNPF